MQAQRETNAKDNVHCHLPSSWEHDPMGPNINSDIIARHCTGEALKETSLRVALSLWDKHTELLNRPYDGPKLEGSCFWLLSCWIITPTMSKSVLTWTGCSCSGHCSYPRGSDPEACCTQAVCCHGICCSHPVPPPASGNDKLGQQAETRRALQGFQGEKRAVVESVCSMCYPNLQQVITGWY